MSDDPQPKSLLARLALAYAPAVAALLTLISTALGLAFHHPG